MDALTELATLLRPAGGGVHTVSTGTVEKVRLQRRLYGGATTEGEVVARWRDDLAGLAEARVGLLAIPSDSGAGLVRGAAFGPGALRAGLWERVPDFRSRCREAGVVDLGDVFVVPQLLHDEMLSADQLAATRQAIYPSVAESDRAVLPISPLSIAERVVALCLSINPDLKLLVLGGDHSVAWPVVAALARSRLARGLPPFAIVHPDAHTDLLPERLGVKYCFATWAFHANEVIGRAGRLVQVGIRASGRPRAHWEQTLGVRQFWAEDVRTRGEARTLDDLFAHLAALGLHDVYLSNDIDGTDAASAPATGAPEPDGLSPTFVRALIGRLGREMSLIGADLVEVAPPIGEAAGSRRTVELAVTYLLDSLAALTRSSAFTTRPEEDQIV